MSIQSSFLQQGPWFVTEAVDWWVPHSWWPCNEKKQVKNNYNGLVDEYLSSSKASDGPVTFLTVNLPTKAIKN